MIRVGLDIHESILGLTPEGAQRLIRRVAESELDFVVVGDHFSFNGGQGFDGMVSATLAKAGIGRATGRVWRRVWPSTSGLRRLVEAYNYPRLVLTKSAPGF